MWHLTSFVFHIRKDIVLFFLFIIQKKNEAAGRWKT